MLYSSSKTLLCLSNIEGALGAGGADALSFPELRWLFASPDIFIMVINLTENFLALLLSNAWQRFVMPRGVKNGLSMRKFDRCVTRVNEKRKRGWKTAKTPLAEGQRIQYNFVKPHMALEGKTPAEAAGLQAKGWKELLERSIT